MQIRIIKRSFYFILLLLISCLPARDISTMNMASDYRTSEKFFHPEFVTYNKSDSIVQLFVKVLPSEFLFVRQADESFRAEINIYAEVIGSYENTKLIDSTSANFSFELKEKSVEKNIVVNVPLLQTGLFLIHCIIKDKNKGFEEEYFVPVDRLSKPSRNDFLVMNKDSIPIFRNYLFSDESVQIIYRDPNKNDFWCKFYKREFPLAAPPYNFDIRYEFDYKPDSLFKISSDELKNIKIERSGFYHIQTDTAVKSGLTLFNFYNGFPDITTPKQMIESVRYLTSKKEFEEMKSSPSAKSAMDNFWLSRGGNEEKTRALIKKYYGRVRDANKFFSSYTEGWRTDRGMIYIIFGSPGTIFKGAETESWIYGSPNSSLALNFFFVKVNNPFTDNDFTLNRSPSYETNWYRAIEVWRQGRVFNSFY
jgi:GWxTD domain-containing protein